MRSRRALRSIGLTCTLLAAACERVEPPAPEPLRPVVTMTISERPNGYERHFAGALSAAERSSLAFQTAGRVEAVDVALGQRVSSGQILARLDPQPFRLRLEAARGELERAQAGFDETERDFDRIEALRRRGAASEGQLDAARSAFESARSAVVSAQAAFDLADRDLRNSELRAPFDGSIAERNIEPFEEVTPGRPVFVLQAEGTFEVEVLIPENVIDRLEVGMPVAVRMAGFRLRDQLFDATVTELGTTASIANAYPVKVAVHDPDPSFRPGMTAEVQFRYQGALERGAWLLPLDAVLAGNARSDQHVTDRELYVYVYDPETSRVSRRPVRLLNVQGEHALIREGLEEGDVVVVAGVHFLRDGQEVRLFDEGGG